MKTAIFTHLQKKIEEADIGVSLSCWYEGQLVYSKSTWWKAASGRWQSRGCPRRRPRRRRKWRRRVGSHIRAARRSARQLERTTTIRLKRGLGCRSRGSARARLCFSVLSLCKSLGYIFPFELEFFFWVSWHRTILRTSSLRKKMAGCRNRTQETNQSGKTTRPPTQHQRRPFGANEPSHLP